MASNDQDVRADLDALDAEPTTCVSPKTILPRTGEFMGLLASKNVVNSAESYWTVFLSKQLTSDVLGGPDVISRPSSELAKVIRRQGVLSELFSKPGALADQVREWQREQSVAVAVTATDDVTRQAHETSQVAKLEAPAHTEAVDTSGLIADLLALREARESTWDAEQTAIADARSTVQDDLDWLEQQPSLVDVARFGRAGARRRSKRAAG